MWKNMRRVCFRRLYCAWNLSLENASLYVSRKSFTNLVRASYTRRPFHAVLSIGTVWAPTRSRAVSLFYLEAHTRCFHTRCTPCGSTVFITFSHIISFGRCVVFWVLSSACRTDVLIYLNISILSSKLCCNALKCAFFVGCVCWASSLYSCWKHAISNSFRHF